MTHASSWPQWPLIEQTCRNKTVEGEAADGRRRPACKTLGTRTVGITIVAASVADGGVAAHTSATRLPPVSQLALGCRGVLPLDCLLTTVPYCHLAAEVPPRPSLVLAHNSPHNSPLLLMCCLSIAFSRFNLARLRATVRELE